MVAFLMLVAYLKEQDPEPSMERTPSIYRCPAVEAESKFFAPMVHQHGFDTYCIEPEPGQNALQTVKLEKVGIIKPSSIDTKANLVWRNKTMDFLNGKSSPREWLESTKALGETVHFLSSPKTKGLRESTGNDSMRAVQAEMLLLLWPGKPCLTADDIWQTRFFPESKTVESWILAMNDYLGPLLYFRAQFPTLVSGTPMLVRADSKPGLLVYKLVKGDKSVTVFVNNGPKSVELPPIDESHITFNKGLDWDAKPVRLVSHGICVENLAE